MKFTLTMPPGINRTYGVTRNGKIPFYKKPCVREWEDQAGWEVKRQWKGKKVTMLGEIEVTVDWYYSRNRDIDAGIKVLLDLFKKQRVYDDDMQVISLIMTKQQDIKNPRAEITIYEMD